MNRESWLEERKTMVGSSDAAAVVGLSPWSNALGVYLDKTGQMPDRPPSSLMAWGLRLEPALAAAYAEETGAEVAPPPRPILRHPAYPWMGASIDRVRADGRVVELKTATRFKAADWGEPGTDEVPEAYIVQVNHQMAVAGASHADVAVLIDGHDFRVYTVPRNDLLIARLIEREEAFWSMVEARTPPAPEWGHAATPGLVEALYAPTGEAVRLGPDAEDLCRAYLALRAGAKGHEKQAEECRARLVGLMGTAGRGRTPSGYRITRKVIERKGFTVKPSAYTDFRVKAPKEQADERAEQDEVRAEPLP